jgi:hypothetical protein
MRIAHLAVGDHSFYLPPDEVEYVMAAAAVARSSGEWFELRDAAGQHLRLLIPEGTLLVLHEYEVEDPSPPGEPNDWEDLNFDL